MLSRYRIVPVITLGGIKETDMVLGALCRGGLPVAEICFRNDCAEECIKYAVNAFPDMLIGAGTVINVLQCRKAISAGAKFIVSPGLSEGVALVCNAANIPYYAGVVTPSDIMRGLSLGLSVFKYFPAENFGGLSAIKALCAAFPSVKFMPTGGINEGNIREYLAHPEVIACGGSWMAKGSAEEIEERTRIAIALAKGE